MLTSPGGGGALGESEATNGGSSREGGQGLVDAGLMSDGKGTSPWCSRECHPTVSGAPRR